MRTPFSRVADSGTASPLLRALCLGVALIAGGGGEYSTFAAQTAACGSGEGSAVAAPIGLQLCTEPSRTTVVTHEQPQPGAKVAAADADGLAALAGLAAGDVIYRVQGRRVESGTEGVAALRDVQNARTILINFWRDGRPYLVRVWTARSN